jgi:hypothetical protein
VLREVELESDGEQEQKDDDSKEHLLCFVLEWLLWCKDRKK